jgi:hypothetical protein
LLSSVTQTAMNGNRPFGVSLLAINHYAGVIWAGAISIALVASPTRLDLPADTSLWKRTLWSILTLIIGWLIYLWARGLWRLRSWARRLQIALALLTLIAPCALSRTLAAYLSFRGRHHLWRTRSPTVSEASRNMVGILSAIARLRQLTSVRAKPLTEFQAGSSSSYL